MSKINAGKVQERYFFCSIKLLSKSIFLLLIVNSGLVLMSNPAHSILNIANINKNESPKESPETLEELTEKARAMEGGKDLEAYTSAWEQVKAKTIEIYGEDHFEVRYIESELAFQYFYTGEFKQAFDIIAPVVDEMAQMGKDYDHKRILLSQKLVPLYTNLGQGAKAIIVQKEVLAHWRVSKDKTRHRKLVNSLNNLSTAKLQRGLPLEALKYADEALEIIEQHPDLSPSEPYLLYNRTNYLSAAGRNNEALLAARYGIRRMAERGEVKHLINGFLLISLATQLHYEGRYAASIEASNSSVSVLQDLYGPHAPRVYQVQTVLLGLLIKQGEYSRAIKLADNLLPVLEKSDGKKTRNYLFFSMGRYRAEFLLNPSIEHLEKYSASITEYESILGKNNRFSVGARTNEMLLNAQLGNYQNALNLAEKIDQHNLVMSKRATLAGKTISAYVAYYDFLLGNLDGLGKVYNIYEQVKKDFEVKLRITDKTLSPNLHEATILQLALKAAINAEDLDKAIEIAQVFTHGGSRTALAKARVRNRDLPEETLKLLRLRQDLLERQAALVSERDFAYQQKNNILVVQLSLQHDKVTSELESATALLSKNFPQWIAAEKIQFANIQTIQNRLTKQEALLMPIVLDKGIVIFTFTHNKKSAEFIKLDALILRQWVTEFRESIQQTGLLVINNNDKARLQRAIQNTASASHKIYNAVFTGNTKQIVNDKPTLIVTTNSYLSTIPFAALVSKNDDASEPQYLIDEHAIVNLPYIGALDSTGQKNQTRASRYIGIGAPTSNQLSNMKSSDDASVIAALPPLPSAAKELNTIAGMGFDKTTLLIGTEAKESKVKNLLPTKNDVIVFATHGLLAGELPDLNEPALVLASSDEDDGILSAKEIAQLDFQAGFVVLSACNTGGEGSGSAEGLSGLASSFFYAGAENLLVSHWPIRDDAAAFLTINTIRNIQSGMSKASALQKAMKDLRQDSSIPNAKHPALWSAFVLVSE